MKVEFELTKQDYINFNLYHIAHSDIVKRSIVKQRYYAVIIYCVIPFILVRFTEAPLWYWLLIFLVFGTIWVALYPLYLKWHVAKSISKMFDEGKNVGILGKRCIFLTDVGVEEIGDSDESKTHWNLIESIGETEKYIYIYNSAVSAYIIPTRAFRSVVEKEEFVRKVHSAVDFAHIQG
jgi:hypothetical protein